MIPIFFDYATPSVMESDRERALIGFSADRGRPVRFHGRIQRDHFLLRIALRAMGDVIWSDEIWDSDGVFLDPVVTVHPDRLFFEAFSRDQSVYALLIVDPTMFVPEGPVVTGTTNIDFTAWLSAALAEIRTFRETWFRIGSEGFEIKTGGAGGRFERKVDLPHAWVRGFLHLQAAMSLPGTRLSVRPVDLLAALRFLRYTKAKVSPRALRFEFNPGLPAQLILEPWEKMIPLKGTEHDFDKPRSIRVWGRRRLRLIEPLLPFADRVDVYLKGRALPSFYAVKMGSLTFILGTTGWSRNSWCDTDGFGTRLRSEPVDSRMLSAVLQKFQNSFAFSPKTLAREMEVPSERLDPVLFALCRQGRIIYDLERREYRYRELFDKPIDDAKLFPPSPRLDRAAQLVQNGNVEVLRTERQETRKIRTLKTPEGPILREVIYRDWHVVGRVDKVHTTEIVVQDNVRIIYGKCSCEFFQEHLFSKGPCAEMLALLEVSEPFRSDLPVSTDQEGIPSMKKPRLTSVDEAEAEAEDEAEDEAEGKIEIEAEAEAEDNSEEGDKETIEKTVSEETEEKEAEKTNKAKNAKTPLDEDEHG
ncbi:MAG: hypothetical protein WA705_11190 [Candidatus Ozemobacteraceae bacterium]